MIASLHRAFERMAFAVAFAGILLLSVSIGVTIVDIVGRKTVGFTIFGINDINQLLVMSAICLAFPYAYSRGAHVAVDFVTDSLPLRLLDSLRTAVALLTACFAGALAWYASAQAAQQVATGDISPTLAIPIAWYWAALLIGLALSTVAALLQAAQCFAAVLQGPESASPRPPAGI